MERSGPKTERERMGDRHPSSCPRGDGKASARWQDQAKDGAAIEGGVYERASATDRGLWWTQRRPRSAKISKAIAVLDRGGEQSRADRKRDVSVFDQMTDDQQKTMLAALGLSRDA